MSNSPTEQTMRVDSTMQADASAHIVTANGQIQDFNKSIKNDTILDLKDGIQNPFYLFANHACVWSIWFNLLSVFIRVALDEVISPTGLLSNCAWVKRVQDKLILGVHRMMLLGMAFLILGFAAFAIPEQFSFVWIAMVVTSIVTLFGLLGFELLIGKPNRPSILHTRSEPGNARDAEGMRSDDQKYSLFSSNMMGGSQRQLYA
ncbi:hypothetical protein BDV93DRAFT_515695 [Ceratobasidium sp. AG-I]|nr:hypothetical protein BDV93DRAFT_515695 [Ceratobasidium sp. AG-I]